MNRSGSDINPRVLTYYLKCNDQTELKKLSLRAREVTEGECGHGVLLRGIVEISSHCRNTCCYCGLQRLLLGMEEILTAVRELYSYGVRTVVLQSGEDVGLPAEWIDRIKRSFSIAVTLSLGEWPYSHYRMWQQAGADRYLLKIETSDRELYHSLHPGMDFDRRIECIQQLQEL
jgi:biotin synthase